MALTRNRLAVGAALAATLSMLSTTAMAADLRLPRSDYRAAPANEVAENGRGRHHRHDDGIDGGDILAGVLILGGIAAIASAASNADQRDRDYRPYPEPQPYPEDPRYSTPGPSYDGGGYRSGGMDHAVDMCVAEVERSAPVGSVDSANRNGDGWFISGATSNGAPWACRIDNDGRISDVEVGDNFSADAGGYSGGYSGTNGAPADGQYDDATYARARAQLGTGGYTPSRE